MSYATPTVPLAAFPAASPAPARPAVPTLHGDQLVRATLPLVLSYGGGLLYGAYLLGLVSVNRSDWVARLLLACFTLPGVMQGSAMVRGVRARWLGSDEAPGWLRLAGHGIRAAGGVVLAFTLVALPPHTALYIGTAAVLITLGETAWSLTEAPAAWRALRKGRPLSGRERTVAVAAAVALLAGPLLFGATRPASAAVATRAAELPARATLETVVASLKETRAKHNADKSWKQRMLAPFPFDTIGLAADLDRRPAPGIRVAYWPTAGGGFAATATRADDRAKCVAILFPGALREFWCTGDAAAPTLFKRLLRPAAPAPLRAWRWKSPG